MFVMDGLAFASEPKASMKVLDAKAVNGLSRLVIFSTGGKRLFDASELTDKPAFKSLKDSRIFGAFSIDHDIVTWDNGEIHLDPETMYAMSYPYDDVRHELPIRKRSLASITKLSSSANPRFSIWMTASFYYKNACLEANSPIIPYGRSPG